ncbi:hypothetical protein CDN99_04580 [Roseateles aquatilis]|uniref:histidine kinase n=1 Tax=Roseateles aquatilis TaxID=431061 RepID=A0A246JM82_9BURK|nr:hybrid sensor histidine kinase/response regulator [Roseateles aquatilis]OWQ93731.1 hypothetical protein CDN99_04580 [Roseateles aquatilis]
MNTASAGTRRRDAMRVGSLARSLLPLLLLLLLILLCGWWTARPAHAAGQAPDGPAAAETTEPGRQRLAVAYLIEQGEPLRITDVAALPDAAWKRRPWSSASYGFGTAPHWFKSEPLRVGPAEGPVLLEVSYPLLDNVDLYVRLNAGKPWQAWHFGDRQPFDQRPYLTRNFVVPVAARPGDVIEIIARVDTAGSMRFPLSAWQPQAFEREERFSMLVNGIYVGLMGAIFLSNFIILLVVRDRIYLHYSGWILMTAAFILSYNGLAFQYLWPNAIGWNDWCRIVFLLLAGGFLTSFTIQLVRSGSKPPWWTRFHGWPVLVASCLVAAVSRLDFPVAVRVALGVQLVVTIGCFALAFHQARKGYVPAKIFLVAFSGVLVGSALHTLDMVGATRILESSINFEVAPQIGSAIAVLLFSLALAHRLLEERRHQSTAARMRQMNESLEAAMRTEQERSKSLLEFKDRLRLEAERRDQDKSRFLADAVHDLRQPLQAIGNALDPIGGAIRAGHTANALSLVEMATRASANMRSQLSAILDLSRLDSGLVEAELSDFDLVSTIRETVEQTRSIAQASHTLIEFEGPVGKPVFVRSDRHFLQRILTNLISNGIKYRSMSGARQSHVKVQLVEDGATTRIAVQDNGIGISAEVLQSGVIFRPFFQINNRHAEAEKGVGLGLSIVSAMLALLKDHKLSIVSTVGQGSTFSLAIPTSVVAPLFEEIPHQDFAQGGIDAARGQYVVVIEDDVLVRETLGAVFSAHGVLYEAWGSIAEMRKELPYLERAPDVLLSDYRLPDEKNALDAMRLMREHWPEVPMIILTGEVLNPELGMSLRGVSLCYKPIAPLDLLRRIAASASRHTAPSNFGTL